MKWSGKQLIFWLAMRVLQLQVVTWRSWLLAPVSYALIGNEDLISSIQSGSFMWYTKHLMPDPANCRGVTRRKLVGQKNQFLLLPLSAQSVSLSKLPILQPSLFFSPASHRPSGLKIWSEKSWSQCSTSTDGVYCCGRLFDMTSSRHRPPLSLCELFRAIRKALLLNVSLKGGDL